jgi:hypothetical protein
LGSRCIAYHADPETERTSDGITYHDGIGHTHWISSVVLRDLHRFSLGYKVHIGENASLRETPQNVSLLLTPTACDYSRVGSSAQHSDYHTPCRIIKLHSIGSVFECSNILGFELHHIHSLHAISYIFTSHTLGKALWS